MGLLNDGRKTIAKPEKFIAYNSGNIFFPEDILTLVLYFPKTTALQIRLSVVLIMTSKFFVTELNSRCVIIGLKFGLGEAKQQIKTPQGSNDHYEEEGVAV